jgi:hypothetical protein
MERILEYIPDKNIVDDILNFINNKSKKHYFSEIYKGRTMIYPCFLMEYCSDDNVIKLYNGGNGLGHYMEVVYLVNEEKYAFYTINDGCNPNEMFKCNDWNIFVTFVRNYLHDCFVWFNEK